VSSLVNGAQQDDERQAERSRPASAGRSPVGELVERNIARTGGRALDGLRNFSQSELEEYGQTARALAFPQTGRIAIRGNHAVGTETDAQRLALERLAAVGGGTLDVEWDDTHRGPADVANLLFVRRDLDAQGLWSAFLDDHFEEVAQIWGIGSRSDLVLSGTSALGSDVMVLSGERLRDGIPVDGEFVEAFVSTASSRLGPGVLTRIKVITDPRRAELPASPIGRWLTVERATAIADSHLATVTSPDQIRAPAEGRTSAQLRWSCGDRCIPYWRVGYRTGWSVSVGAVDGEILQSNQHIDRIGPVTMTGLPPGVSRTALPAARTIRLRSANVVNPSGGATLGHTYVDGTHGLTQSTPVQIGLEGPVGASDPAHVGRVERQDYSTWAPVPFRVNWTPSTDPAKNFSDPTDFWAPNTTTGMYPHSTALLYGWFTYWQGLVRDHLYQEVVQRLAFLFDSVGNLACGFSGTDNFGSPSPDPNGSTTWGSIFCQAGSTDTVGTTYDSDGDAIMSASHEFGHTVQNCASQSGAGCANLNPSAIPLANRPPSSSWFPDIWDASKETIAQLFAATLTKYQYTDALRPVESYNESWTYTSYNSTSDDFGSVSQDAGSTLNCPSQVTCGAGFVCAALDGGYNGVNPNGGICERTCVTDSDCQRGLRCEPWAIRPSGTASICKPNTNGNQFLQTLGTRLVFTTGWRDGLAGILYSTGGQSGNATRDFVLGTDSYYTRLLNNSTTRYEVSRGVRSVYSGSGFVVGDDFPDYPYRGAAIPVRSNSWTPLWWGNGAALYPKLEDNYDTDVVIFRGIAGSSYRVETWFKDTAGSPTVEIAQLDNPSTYWSSTTGSLTTPSLSTTGWYSASVWGGSGAQRWEGRMRVEAGYDDLSSSIAEALPMAHSFTAFAAAHSVGDADAFQIHVPVASTSLEIQVTPLTGLSSATILLYDPSGTFYASHAVTPSSTSWLIPSLPVAGHWTWLVLANATGTYWTAGLIGCATASPACDVSPGIRSVRNPSWGDNFAGRLPTSSTEHVYRIHLVASQGVSVSVSDTQQPCAVEVSAYGPSTMTNLRGLAITRWTDGAAVADPGGNTAGAGGYIEALADGDYDFHVRPAPGATCGYYRIHLATSTQRGFALPAW